MDADLTQRIGFLLLGGFEKGRKGVQKMGVIASCVRYEEFFAIVIGIVIIVLSVSSSLSSSSLSSSSIVTVV